MNNIIISVAIAVGIITSSISGVYLARAYNKSVYDMAPCKTSVSIDTIYTSQGRNDDIEYVCPPKSRLIIRQHSDKRPEKMEPKMLEQDYNKYLITVICQCNDSEDAEITESSDTGLAELTKQSE